MTNVTLTMFMSMKTVKKSCDCELDFTDPATPTLFNQAAQLAHASKGMPRYWGFADYTDKHQQGSLNSNPAIVLEYAYAQRQALVDRITELGWNALIFNADRAKAATVVVVLPLEKPITEELKFTRAATVIADTIGIYDLMDGKSNTFLVEPAQKPRAELIAGKALGGYELNRDGWLEFKDYCQAKPASQIAGEALCAIGNEHLTKTRSQQIASHFRALADLFEKEDF